MHNNIMAAGSKERPPMLGPGRYSQWHSRFLRLPDTKSNVNIEEMPYLTFHNMPTNVDMQQLSSKEHSPLAAHEKQRGCGQPLKGYNKGNRLNVQDVQTNLFWKFGKYTSRDGESMES
ncbi:hypothetical protein Tco_1050452 [Tanacetum coccineum]